MGTSAECRPRLRRRRWHVCFALTTLFCAAWAQVGEPQQPRRDGPPRRAAEHLLVLTNGRVVEGVVKKSASGYVLERPTGSLLIPYEQVRFEATDLGHAYRKLRASVPERSATNHLALARWCLVNQLHDEARTELRDALTIEPSREDARAMLRRLEEILNPDEPLHRTLPQSTPLTSDGFAQPNVQSLAGLSRESARAFVGQVQPTLMNKCGNASCHGPAADNDFRLTPVRIGQASRVAAERNLAVVLNYVDVNAPRNSRLLTEPLGNHGSTGRAIFHGTAAADQQNLLRDWVLAVAQERNERRRRDESAPSLMRGSSTGRLSQRPSDGKRPTTKAEKSLRRRSGNYGLPWQRELSLRESPFEPAGVRPTAADRMDAADANQPIDPRDEILERILRDERNDAFDPDAFNRFNGQP